MSFTQVLVLYLVNDLKQLKDLRWNMRESTPGLSSDREGRLGSEDRMEVWGCSLMSLYIDESVCNCSVRQKQDLKSSVVIITC